MHVVFVVKDPLPDPIIVWGRAGLVAAGHTAEVWVPGAEPELHAALRAADPGLIALAPHSGFEAWCCAQAAELGEAVGCKTALFGPHVGARPDLVKSPGVDLLLEGDPELALPALVGALESNSALADVPGAIVAGDDGSPARGPAPLVADRLEDLPAADPGAYRRYPWVGALRTLRFAIGRGQLENLHADSTTTSHELAHRFSPARRLRPTVAVARIASLAAAHGSLRRVSFLDDTLTGGDPEDRWMAEFLHGYRAEVGLPFSCSARPDLLPFHRIRQLASAGCDLVRLGVESGDEGLREAVVGSPLPDANILQTARELKGAGIGLQTVGFLGLPGETIDTALKLLQLNRRLRPQHAFAIAVRDDDTPLPPAVERLRQLLPLAVDVPPLALLTPTLIGQSKDDLYGTLFQLHYDASALRWMDLRKREVLGIAKRMRGGRQ